MANEEIIAHPRIPSSTYVYGKAKVITTTIIEGPVFQPWETKLLKTGLSAVCAAPCLICVAQYRSDDETGSPFGVPFTIVEQTDAIDIAVPVTNQTPVPRTCRNPEDTLTIVLFTVKLEHVHIEPIHIFCSGHSPFGRRERAPHRVTSTSVPTGHLTKIVLKRTRWLKYKDVYAHATHVTSVVCTFTDLAITRYNSAQVRAVSDPAVRLSSVEIISGADNTARFILFYDGHIYGDAPHAPPDTLMLQIHLTVNRAPVIFRRNPEPLLSKINENGFYVRCPRRLDLRKGTTTTVTIDNGFISDTHVAFFFPKTHPDLEMTLSTWQEKKRLVFQITTLRDTVLPFRSVLGRVHFFSKQNGSIYQMYEERVTPQSQLLMHLTQPADSQPASSEPPSMLPSAPPAEQDLQELFQDENEIPDFSDDDIEDFATDSSDDETVDFSTFASDTTEQRNPLSEIPPRQPRPRRETQYVNPDDIARPIYVGMALENEPDCNKYLLNARNSQFAFRVSAMEQMMYTAYTPMLEQLIYFTKAGTDKIVVNLSMIAGRFVNLPSKSRTETLRLTD
uniref:Tegument protein pp71 n=1 Tax=Mastomys natalensis cytomegalovirus 2 TaxID=2973540 RepID=A0A9Y1ILI3_9BETA|nr:tegument protein pp71 [Mastomys natalensis cytomegalovirus 2]WEG69217.1 tegument protein pp71 [Mastomys natalensis cytomegalovirus 2]WEG69356.1 tegument protein pp71 [Mastomys natalensis cytomegalovirus 2]WEG69494.1 tegument protein pp71 [Mastomys natalensis cytomegalovirus 2]WEG69632.1 tegument protein pp71 [Mastomys natalensis cytomegalovirus 2]